MGRGVFSGLSYAGTSRSVQDGGQQALPKVQKCETRKNPDFERNWGHPKKICWKMFLIWNKKKNMFLPWVRSGIVVKNWKNKNTAKWIFRKARNDPEVEPDAWPKNPKSREVFRGQCRDRPQAKVRKVCFYMVTEYFWNHRKGIFGNLFRGYYKK